MLAVINDGRLLLQEKVWETWDVGNAERLCTNYSAEVFAASSCSAFFPHVAFWRTVLYVTLRLTTAVRAYEACLAGARALVSNIISRLCSG